MNHPHERLADLLADRALVGLDPAEDAELARLAATPGAQTMAEELELAAAAVALAAVAEQGLLRLPEAARRRIEATAQPETARMPVAGSRLPASPGSVHHAPMHLRSMQQNADVVPLRPEPRRASRAVAIGGWLAAAACLALAIGTWYLRPRVATVAVAPPAPSATTAPTPTPRPASPAEERDRLLATAGTTRLDWAANANDPAATAASGDVVWNAAEQRGFMRFRGLAKNDRRESVYQLWIFDKDRDDRYPVDGGVFDVDGGDVIVPIHAKLPVAEVALFAVTVEKPGGVVVSKRDRIVVTAKPAG